MAKKSRSRIQPNMEDKVQYKENWKKDDETEKLRQLAFTCDGCNEAKPELVSIEITIGIRCSKNPFWCKDCFKQMLTKYKAAFGASTVQDIGDPLAKMFTSTFKKFT